MSSLTIPLFKRCTKCGNEYPATNEYFNRSSRSKDGLKEGCKDCRKREYNTNREIAIQQSKTWAINNSSKRKVILDRYAQNHPDEGKRRYWSNRPKALKASSEYYNKHKSDPLFKAKRRIECERRRSKIANLNSNFTHDDWHRALIFFEGRCAYCEKPPSLFDHFRVLHQDHFIPVNNGGHYTSENILPSCQLCNYGKSDSDPREWIIARFGPRKAKQILKRIDAYFAWVKENNPT